MKTRHLLTLFCLLVALMVICLLHQPNHASSQALKQTAPDALQIADAAPERQAAAQPTFKPVRVKARQARVEFDIRPDKLILPQQDNEALIRDALDRQKKKLTYRFATRMELGRKASEIGVWKRQNGMAIWQLRLESPNATSLNLGLDQFHMPPGGAFVFSGNRGRDVYTFTSADNKEHGELWTPIVRGNTAMLEIQVAEQLLPQLRFRIEAINHGFRGIQEGRKIGGDTSGSCNVDVACSQGDVTFGDLIDFYRDQIRSVGAYTVDGIDTCSGALINNTSFDQRPLFLTANHCNVNMDRAASVVVYWNFENSTCRQPGSGSSGGVGDGDLTVFNTGSVYRSSFSSSDFCLVELDSPVNPASDAFYAGWNRQNIAPADMVIGIHHPAVAEKRISFEYDPTTRTNYSSTAADSSTGTHIRVIDWDEGTTEGGSSGSPLFNSSGQIVGQLHGGSAACGNNLSDWYGRIYRSWTGGGTYTSRLSDWLDPASTGATSIDGINLREYLTIADATISEGDSGTQILSVTVSLSEASSDTITCEASVTGGDAVAGSDFVDPGAQTLTFNPGMTSATYDITINGDTDPEENESIIVTLSNPTNTSINDAQATAIILNDDFIAPVVTGPTSESGNEGVPFSALITANNTPTSYSLSGEPEGMTVDSLSGEISWPFPINGSYSITLHVSNSAGSDSANLNLSITPSDVVTAFEIPSNAPHAMYGDYNWALQTTEHVDGEDALVATGTGNATSTHLELTIDGPDQLLFHRKVSTEANSDYFVVYLNEDIVEKVSGLIDWTPVLIDIPSGQHKVTIAYLKDASTNSNADSVWIDRMTLASSSPPDFNSPHNILVPSGVPVAIDINPSFNVTHARAVSLPPGAEFAQDNHVSGTFTSTQNFTVEATNAFGTTTRQFTVTPYATDSSLADAVGAPSLSFEPASSAAWFAQSSVSRSGGTAIRSGTITHNQESVLSTQIFGPGNITFHWRSSSESGYDFGEFHLNGEIKRSISGSATNWQANTFPLEPGLNAITWKYTKDGSVSSGADCVYVDDVSLSGFAGWVAGAGLSPFSAPPTSGTDGDLNSALMEYALGGSASSAEGTFMPTLTGEPGSIVVTTPVRSATSGISVNIQKSSDLEIWSNMTPTTTSPTLRVDDTTADPKAFYRIHVDAP